MQANRTWFDVHVHKLLTVDVLETEADLSHHVLELVLGETRPSPHVHLDLFGETASVAVLRLDVEVALLSPGGVVAHDVAVLAQGCLRVHLVAEQAPEKHSDRHIMGRGLQHGHGLVKTLGEMNHNFMIHSQLKTK